MVLPPISESVIEQNTTDASFGRGEDYYGEGAVIDIVQRGNAIEATVEGSEAQPYRVSLRFDSGGITSVHCTCPYDYGGWCKHIVATALTCIRNPDEIAPRPTLEQLLDRLDHVQTQRLVQALIAKHPNLIDVAEREVTLMTQLAPAKSAKPSRRTKIDTAPIRRQVQYIVRDALRFMEDGYEEDPISEKLLELVARAQAFSEQGDGQSAIAILEAITAAYADSWDDLLEYGGDCFSITDQLNEAWAEAILCADLAQAEKVDLEVMLEEWQDLLETDFSMSLTALRQGWDDPQVVQVLQGQVGSEAELPPLGPNLALIRLRILDRQERQQEYLNLAQAAGLTQQYLTRLAELGRVSEALAAARERMTTAEEAFALAKTLREGEHLPEALAIAKAGLVLPGFGCYDLARWTSELAEGMGQTDQAVQASMVAFHLRPNLVDYRRVDCLAPEQWPNLKPELLQALRDYQEWNADSAKVDIFLYEGLIEEAIQIVDSEWLYRTDLLHRVMEAALPDRPDWVIEKAQQQAEPIMTQGKSDHYQEAVKWLQKAKAAYLQSDQAAAWAAYFDQLKTTHARKRKLMTLFQQLP